MVRKKKKSSLSARIQKENARETSRTAEAKAPGGGARLPAGITDGLAKLTRVDFDKIKKGKYEGSQRLYVHGVCIEPKTIENEDGREIKVEGRLVQPGMITLDDTEGFGGNEVSFADNVKKAENRLKLLGFPTEDFDDLEQETLDYFEENKDEMFFTFRTWSPEPDDDDDEEARVIVIIEGSEDHEESDEDDGVDEEEEEEEEKPAPKSKGKGKGKGKTKDKPKSKSKSKAKKEVDLDELAEAADDGDEDAQRTIVEEAEKEEIDSEDPEFEDWSDVVAAILESKEGGSKDKDDKDDDGDEEEEEEEVDPEVGDLLNFKPPRARKMHEVEVLKVYPKKKLCDVQSSTNDKIFKNIAWDKLQG